MQVSPRIWKVAVPRPQHSAMFGQRASSQIVCRLAPWISFLHLEVARVRARRAHLHPLGAAGAFRDGDVTLCMAFESRGPQAAARRAGRGAAAARGPGSSPGSSSKLEVEDLGERAPRPAHGHRRP